MQLILSYFPELKASQIKRFERMLELYQEWNERINLVSRKDIERLEERHILHSLSIAKFHSFKKGSKVLDVGTGGGFPGIPLAVLFPGVNFHLVDSIAKKIMVVSEISKELGLQNVKAEQIRVEGLKGKYDYIVSRAVAPTPKLLEWTRKLKVHGKTTYFFLKGGDLQQELKATGFRAKEHKISSCFKEAFFETKKVVEIKAY